MIISAKQQKTIEQACLSLGMAEGELMRRTGEAAAEYILKNCSARPLNACVLCGSGGNGGDGLAVARVLAQAGAHVAVVLCDNVPKNPQAAMMYREALAAAVPVLDAVAEQTKALDELAGAQLIVDAVYGTGFRGELPEKLGPVMSLLPLSHAQVVALDLPSGVNADTGECARGGVHADTTLCFIAQKPAHVLKGSRERCGETVLLDAGVPAEALALVKDTANELTQTVASRLLPPKDPGAHKGKYGRLLCVTGAPEYRGAAVLCATGAVRAGAGIVEVASRAPVLDAVAAHLPEAILYDIYGNDIELFMQRVERASALVLGCGLGESEDAQRLTELTLLGAKVPTVLDADGINALAGNINWVKETGAPLVLTPHLGEFARLTGTDIQEVRANRFAAARFFAQNNRCVVVLKSENTVVAAPDGALYILGIGNAGLAKGGSGDLLAGMVGAYLAMGHTPLDAALLGVYLHAKAADITAQSVNPYAMTASDVAGRIGAALDSLPSQKRS